MPIVADCNALLGCVRWPHRSSLFSWIDKGTRPKYSYLVSCLYVSWRQGGQALSIQPICWMCPLNSISIEYIDRWDASIIEHTVWMEVSSDVLGKFLSWRKCCCLDCIHRWIRWVSLTVAWLIVRGCRMRLPVHTGEGDMGWIVGVCQGCFDGVSSELICCSQSCCLACCDTSVVYSKHSPEQRT